MNSKRLRQRCRYRNETEGSGTRAIGKSWTDSMGWAGLASSWRKGWGCPKLSQPDCLGVRWCWDRGDDEIYVYLQIPHLQNIIYYQQFSGYSPTQERVCYSSASMLELRLTHLNLHQGLQCDIICSLFSNQLTKWPRWVWWDIHRRGRRSSLDKSSQPRETAVFDTQTIGALWVFAKWTNWNNTR